MPKKAVIKTAIRVGSNTTEAAKVGRALNKIENSMPIDSISWMLYFDCELFMRFEMVERITISLPKHISDSVNVMVAERKISRSQLLAELIQAEQTRLVEKELAEGYIALAEEHRRFAEVAVTTAGEIWPRYEQPT